MLDHRRFEAQASIQRQLEADAQRSIAVAATSGRPLHVIGEEDTVEAPHPAPPLPLCNVFVVFVGRVK